MTQHKARHLRHDTATDRRARAIARLEAARDRAQAELVRIASASPASESDTLAWFHAVMNRLLDRALFDAALEAAAQATAHDFINAARTALVARAEELDHALGLNARARQRANSGDRPAHVTRSKKGHRK